MIILTTIKVSNVLPRRLWLFICGMLGKLVFIMARGLKEQVARNLGQAFKNEMTAFQIRELTKQVFVMLSKNAGITLRNFRLSSEENYKKHVVVSGVSHAVNAFRSSRGVIFLTAHLGPFECVATELSLRGFKPYIVGTPLKDPNLNKLLFEQREKFGAVVIERGKDTYRLIKNVASGGTMALLIDQDTSVKSVFVDFFGKPCSTPAGAAYMAMKTGAAVIPVFAHLNKNGIIGIDYYPEVEITKTGNETVDIITNTQRFTSIIENEIRKFPDQWVWMHNRWKTPPLTLQPGESPVNDHVADRFPTRP